jgi:hypothetical protein
MEREHRRITFQEHLRAPKNISGSRKGLIPMPDDQKRMPWIRYFPEEKVKAVIRFEAPTQQNQNMPSMAAPLVHYSSILQ